MLSVGIAKSGSGNSCIPPDMLSFKPAKKKKKERHKHDPDTVKVAVLFKHILMIELLKI